MLIVQTRKEAITATAEVATLGMAQCVKVMKYLAKFNLCFEQCVHNDTYTIIELYQILLFAMQILMSVSWVHIYVTVMLHVTTQMEAITVLANLAFLAMVQNVKVRMENMY